jgi:hypothetical protein
MDQGFADDLTTIGRDFLTPQSRAEFNTIIRDRVLSRVVATGGDINPADYQVIRSDLGRLAREFGASQDVAQREMARGFSSLQRAFDDLLARTNPTVAPDIRRANAAYGAFVRMQQAGAAPGAADGVFSAAQLNTAVRAQDRTPMRRDFARGEATLQDMSNPAQQVLPSVVRNSGTPERAAMMGLLAGGSSLAGMISPAQLAAAGGVYGAYSSPAVLRAIQAAALAQRPASVQAAGNAVARSGGAASVPLGAYLLSPPPPQ